MPEGEGPLEQEARGSRIPIALRRTSSDSWWWITMALAIGIVLGLGVLRLFGLLSKPLALLLLAITIAAALSPVVRWLSRWLPRTLAVLLTYVLAFLFFAIVGLLTIPTIIAQGEAVISRAPVLLERGQQILSEFNFPVSFDGTSLLETVTSQLGTLGAALVSLPLRLFSSVVDILLVLGLSIYWLILTPNMSRFVCSLFPAGRNDRVARLLEHLGTAIGGYFRGAFLDGLIVAILTYIGMMVIGVNYALVLGIFAGLMELVPMVGPLLSGALIILVALIQSPTTALIAIVFVIILQQIEGNILVPNIMRSQTDVSPLLGLFAIFVGSSLGGLLGALLAIPIAAALRVLVLQVIAPAVRNWTGAAPEREEEEAAHEPAT